MSVALRIIPCLDVADGRVVKGVKFENLQDAGNPVELAQTYSAHGADELTFLDVSASVEGRSTTLEVVQKTAEEVFVPLTVGGGIRHVTDVEHLLRAGADKVSVSTAAVTNPGLLSQISSAFGSQVLVLSVDARRSGDGYEVTTHGGRKGTGISAVEWAKQAVDAGVGEILLNSIDSDGTKDGFDLEMIESIRKVVDVPLIASGGAGTVQHFVHAAQAGADALLAASVFHFGTIKITEVKEALAQAGFEIRRE